MWVLAGCWMFRRALNWLSLPRVERPRSSEVTDMQITLRHACIFPGRVVSRHSVNNIMEMCSEFAQCLSWITRQSNEPVSTATVTE